MRIKKIKKENVILFLKDLPRKIALRFFWVFFVLWVVSILVGILVFWESSKVLEEEKFIFKKPHHFKKDTYKEVIEYWERKKIDFENIATREYKDIFEEKQKISLDNTLIIEESSSTVSTTSQEQFSTTTQENSQLQEATSTEEKIDLETEKLLAARSLFEFYLIKGEKFPYLWQRAEIWEEKGLGSKDGYKGTEYQNNLLLRKLKEELTQ